MEIKEYIITNIIKVKGTEAGTTKCPNCGKTIGVYTRNSTPKACTTFCSPKTCNTKFDPNFNPKPGNRYWAQKLALPKPK